MFGTFIIMMGQLYNLVRDRSKSARKVRRDLSHDARAGHRRREVAAGAAAGRSRASESTSRRFDL